MSAQQSQNLDRLLHLRLGPSILCQDGFNDWRVVVDEAGHCSAAVLKQIAESPYRLFKQIGLQETQAVLNDKVDRRGLDFVGLGWCVDEASDLLFF